MEARAGCGSRRQALCEAFQFDHRDLGFGAVAPFAFLHRAELVKQAFVNRPAATGADDFDEHRTVAPQFQPALTEFRLGFGGQATGSICEFLGMEQDESIGSIDFVGSGISLERSCACNVPCSIHPRMKNCRERGSGLMAVFWSMVLGVFMV
jgi:hypothetical protein